jgi:hypothetical protein
MTVIGPPPCAVCNKEYDFMDCGYVVDKNGKHYLGHNACLDKLEEQWKNEESINTP